MINTNLYSDFCFLKVTFNKYHYTDNRIGSPYHYFAYMEKGTARIVTKDKTISIKEGDIFYIPKSLGYQSYWYGNEEVAFFSYGCNNLFASDAKALDLQVIKSPAETANQLKTIPTDGTRIKIRDIGLFFSTVAKLLPHMEKEFVSNLNDALTMRKTIYIQILSVPTVS